MKKPFRIPFLMLAAMMVLIGCVSCKARKVDVDEWAQSVFDEALQHLVSEGVFEYQPEGYIFKYTQTESGDRFPFVSDEAIARYVDNSADVGDKVIYGYWRERSGFTVYENEFPTDKKPLYMPALPNGNVPLYGGIDPARFANHVDECQTLIIYGGFVSSRAVDAYLPGVDRVGITTLVFIIDAQERKLQHVEVIGTDLPGVSTDLSRTTGDTFQAEAEEYALGLLGA